MPRSTENTVTVALMVIQGRPDGISLFLVSGYGQQVPMREHLHALSQDGGNSHGDPRCNSDLLISRPTPRLCQDLLNQLGIQRG